MRQLGSVRAMNFDAALRRYRTSLFSDHDVTRCTGLSVRSWRELIKIGAVRTVTKGRGPGRVRLCDATTLKRTAVIAALNRSGFSLAVSGRIAYFLPFDTMLYAIWDPCTILFSGAAADPETGHFPRLEHPKADWFDPDKPAKADPETDWFIEIYEGRFVGVILSDGPEVVIYGDLRNEGRSFVSWLPYDQLAPFVGPGIEVSAQRVPPYKIGEFVPKWQDPNGWSDRLDPGFLDYKHEDHSADGDPFGIAADAATRSPAIKTTINVTLTIRKALRRYLGIELAAPGSQGEAE
jgi:hypothetical protein